MIFYKTSLNSIEILPVEVEKETESSVWIKGYCLRKDTYYHKLFASKEEAFTYLSKLFNYKIENLKSEIISLEKKLTQLNKNYAK